MNQITAKTNLFQALTWDDLTQWAGATIVERGKTYQRSRYVNNLAFSPTGELLAWVDGRERYATLVDIRDGPHLQAKCTCPYWSNCKHAVAVVLEYLAQVRNHQEIPVAGEQDPRLVQINRPTASRDDDDDDDDLDEVDFPVRPSSTQRAEALRAYLEQQTKPQLIELIETLARRYGGVHEYLRDRLTLATADTDSMIAAAEQEIGNLDIDTDWDEEDYSELNLSRLREQLEALLAHGRADDVIEMGDQLLEAGARRVEHEEEGESACDIRDCMKVVFQALARSSLPAVEQMRWAVDMQLQDEYDLCSDGGREFWRQEFPATAWSALADILHKRLAAMPVSGKKNDFSSDYRRDRLSDWIIRALEAAGRQAEILPLCEREAERSGNYMRLVNRLKAAGQREAAEQWINKGIIATRDSKPGIANELRNAFRELREQAKDWAQVAAMDADNFFRAPSLHNYQALRRTAEKAGVWPSVKAIALAYLETGKGHRAAKDPPWPLPEPAAASLAAGRRVGMPPFPELATLIDIAIDEKQPAQVLRWYDLQQADSRRRIGWAGFGNQNDRVADAIAEDYPDRAIAIWRKIAESHIAHTQPKAYQQAVIYLRKIKALLEKEKRASEWRALLQELRKQHARKRKLMEVLDQLEQGAILR